MRGICLGGTDGYTRRYRVMDPVLTEQRDENVTVTQPNIPSTIWASIQTCGIIDSMTQQNF